MKSSMLLLALFLQFLCPDKNYAQNSSFFWGTPPRVHLVPLNLLLEDIQKLQNFVAEDTSFTSIFTFNAHTTMYPFPCMFFPLLATTFQNFWLLDKLQKAPPEILFRYISWFEYVRKDLVYKKQGLVHKKRRLEVLHLLKQNRSKSHRDLCMSTNPFPAVAEKVPFRCLQRSSRMSQTEKASYIFERRLNTIEINLENVEIRLRPYTFLLRGMERWLETYRMIKNEGNATDARHILESNGLLFFLDAKIKVEAFIRIQQAQKDLHIFCEDFNPENR